MTTALRLLPFVIVLSLAACKPAEQAETPQAPASTGISAPAAQAPVHKPATTNAQWQCGDLQVATRFDDATLETMIVQVSGNELSLKAARTDDGARFSDAAGNEFWSRPGKTSLTLAGKKAVDCSKARPASK